MGFSYFFTIHHSLKSSEMTNWMKNNRNEEGLKTLTLTEIPNMHNKFILLTSSWINNKSDSYKNERYCQGEEKYKSKLRAHI